MKDHAELNPVVMKVLLWSGVVLVAALIIAQGFMMGFIPGPSPGLSPEEIKSIFVQRQDSILLGAVVQIICWSFYGTWAIPIIMFIRRMEKAPILTYASLVNVGGGWVFFILIPMTWAVMAFRAETLPAFAVQIMNDWVWFDWLFTWPSFSIWMFIIAAAVLMDHNSPSIFPRWVGYFNLWTGLLISPAALIAFFKTGPFAYDGLISFWFAVFVFFGWMVTMTVVTYQRVLAEEQRAGSRTAPSSQAAVS
jgi:hypothetical protein